ncbi:MAG: glucosidase, partial [Chloroflexi bacterium]|nr:glucosidase [Chloroflexota bacterium]
YELVDTGVFAEDRYFDVTVEYAKAGPDDLVMRFTATNRGPDAATLHLLPTLWYRNTWSWGRDGRRPLLMGVDLGEAPARAVRAVHHTLGTYHLICEGEPQLLFAENETNMERLCGQVNRTPYVKDGVHRAVVSGEMGAVNPENAGTKVAAHYVLHLAPGAAESVTLRLAADPVLPLWEGAGAVIERRRAEADAFYLPLCAGLGPEECDVMRQALAGLLWSKQYYNYDVRAWMEGDPLHPAPPERKYGRNHDWLTLVNDDVICMPDTWEYPWYASWDLAFHCVPLALVDAGFAKQQVSLFMQESYMKPDGQVPAYEWAFGQVNPPVLAWAALKVYGLEKAQTGAGDLDFLERVFHKLLINFTWWVNRKDRHGRNVFEGGFLGLDNIGVFNRDASLPTGGYLQQADATAWMGMFSLNMLAIALELAAERPLYEDIAYKFVEHFMYIAGAMNQVAGGGCGLWDEEDGFFYDCLGLPDGTLAPLKVRSLVGLIPLCAVLPLDPGQLRRLPRLHARLESFLAAHPELADLVARRHLPGEGDQYLLALAPAERMRALLRRMLDPAEFLGDYGIRSLSKYHLDRPYAIQVNGERYEVGYEPGPSTSPIFGGNSNWRGPVWFPLNYLLIEALQTFHAYYGDGLAVEYPTGSGALTPLAAVADDLATRLTGIFRRDARQRRPVYGANPVLQGDPHWRPYLLFFEYFHGDTGEGLGASHQTGWTALVASLLRQLADRAEKEVAGGQVLQGDLAA